MKILLAKPFNISDHIQPSLGLGYLATAVRKEHDVEILDCIKEGLVIERIEQEIRKRNPDAVGFQFYTFDNNYISKALAIIKGINPRIITLTGGPHPTAVPEETMSEMGDTLDFSFKGEAETGLPLLLKEITLTAGDKGRLNSEILSTIPGLIWRRNGSTMVNAQVFREDLDELGFPAWDLIRPDKYPEAQHGAFFENFPIAPIMITRGCPFQCTFCGGSLITGKKVRFRSVGHVMQEIEMLYKDYGIREIHIVDDNFTMKPDYAKEFCRKLIASGLKISWATPNGVRVDTLDEELLRLMKESGLYLISLGIESGSDRILKLMKKHLDTANVRERIKLIRKVGIDIAGFFIIGFPGETKEEIRQTIKFSTELDLLRANFFTYLPFPGTESYKELAQSGEIKKVDFSNFYFMSAPYTPAGITREELRGLQKEAFNKFFFLRPWVILRNIAKIKTFNHFKFLFRRFLRWMFKG